MSRFGLFLPSILILILQLPVTAAGNVIVHAHPNKVLAVDIYQTITSVDPTKCLELCLADCHCLSFQICQAAQECQLLSALKKSKESSFMDSQDCVYVEFEYKATAKLHAEPCSNNKCMPDVNCCLTSTPCSNGGICIPSPFQHQRFTCKCKPGFGGQFCKETLKTSCHDHIDESNSSGNYTVFDKNGEPYQVFCDFDKNTMTSWTLVQSFSLKNKDKFATPFINNNPRNEDNFTWAEYRLSYERMAYVHQRSSKWRITCNYETEGIPVSSDYVRARISSVPLFKLFNNDDHGGCVLVRTIRIRNKVCHLCNAYMIQTSELPLHFDGGKTVSECGADIDEIMTCPDGEQEDSFGNYECVNPAHACSSSEIATTQTWLGMR